MRPANPALVLAACLCAALPALAADKPMRRVLTCVGPDATMEIYLPESDVSGVGVDNVDLPTATKHGIVVMNAPDGNTTSTCELTIALMLAQPSMIKRPILVSDGVVLAGFSADTYLAALT